MPRVPLTLLAAQHPLASPEAQRARLAALPVFTHEITAASASTLQINVGKQCNQACNHCHVDAGPDRKEIMPDDVVDACLAVIERERFDVVDITGGAPELHPRFEELVTRARRTGARVIDRCNLTVLTLSKFAHLPRFFAEHDVEVVSSLPHFEAERTDAQRGEGVFEKSIAAIKQLNAAGYGVDPARSLTLVANPTGAFLPAPERSLEADFRNKLALVDVKFTRLAVLTNMPIARYLEWLDRTGNTARYMGRLLGAFNASTLAGLMCRTHVSVGWDGRLWDCDFNQMLELDLDVEVGGMTIHTWDRVKWASRRVATASHCYGCTAGQGSSCGGALLG
jgi:radical SAM/Cys-rich protein